MHYYCHSCGSKNLYVNGVKPKFCSSCGCSIDVTPAKPAREESQSSANRQESRSSWRDEWKAKSHISDEEGDINEIMSSLKRDAGINVEKPKMLTIADLKEMSNFDGRSDAPQTDKDLANVRSEIMKNFGVNNS
jgi:uncharacterized Zn finger protein (UPF0148 family)